MKKITKKAVLLLLIMGSTFCQSQESPNFPKALFIAQKQLVEGSSSYNPTAAVATYKQLAESGNAQMNGLGLIHSKGITVPVNEIEGVKWFEKAANAGYSKA